MEGGGERWEKEREWRRERERERERKKEGKGEEKEGGVEWYCGHKVLSVHKLMYTCTKTKILIYQDYKRKEYLRE